MGLVDKLVGERDGRSMDDYAELDAPDSEVADKNTAECQIHVASLESQTDMLDIKDALYEGDIVIADISGMEEQSRQLESYTDELKQAAHEVGGDIAQMGEDQIIIAPTGVAISRTKLGGL